MSAAAHPFFLLLRSRRAWFRRQSFALYLRYSQVLGMVLALCGLLLVERPALPAEPILHFWREAGTPGANAAWAGAWLACVALWAGIHRDFAAGGALAAYARSLPLAPRTLALVDAVMLLVSLQVFLVPAGLAAWTVLAQGGGEHWFGLRAALLAAASLGAAQAAQRATPLALALPAAGYPVLVFLGSYGAFEPIVLALALAALLAGLARVLAAGPRQRAAGRGRRVPGPHPGGRLFLFAWQFAVLARRHLHAALPRIALAAGLLAGCLWMIFSAGKLSQSSAFLQVGCWLAAAVLSGLFHLFWTARAPLRGWLRSLPFGTLRLALAEQACVLGLYAAIVAGAWAASRLQPGQGGAVAGQLLRHGLGGLATLALLGAPIIQHHRDGVLLKVVVLIATFLIL